MLDPTDITIYGNVDPTFTSTDSSVDLGSDLEIWLDASDVTTVLDAEGDQADSVDFSGLVTTWLDKSGNGNDATQTNVALQYAYLSDAVSGYFDGTGALGAPAALTELMNLSSTVAGNTVSFVTDYDNTIDFSGIIGSTGINSYIFLHNTGYDISVDGSVADQGDWYMDGALKGSGGNIDGPGTIDTLTHIHTVNYNTGDPSSGLDIIGAAADDRNSFAGKIREIITYSDYLTTSEQQILEQYQAAKWGVALTPPGTGATEVAQATASDGYSVFTSDYLEYLSTSADIVLQADNSIVFDLQGDTLALDADRSISFTVANGDISDVSAGTIQTTRTAAGGNIDMTTGGTGNITLDSTNLQALGGGDITLTAGNDIALDGSTVSAGSFTARADQNISITGAGFTASSGALDVILNADRDADQSGNITLTDSTITTSGGDFIAGGGVDPTTTAAYGAAAGDVGIALDNVQITTDSGLISLRGHASDDGASSSQYGVHIHSASTLNTTSGAITIDGIGGSGEDYNQGVRIENVGTLITSVDGAISITGQGGSNGNATSYYSHGVFLFNGAIISSTGTGASAATITLSGTAGAGEFGNRGVVLNTEGSLITSVDGAISITGQGGSNGSGTSTDNYGVYLVNGADITSTGTGGDAATITLNGTGGAGEEQNTGVFIDDAGSLITSIDGTISITGQGGSSGTASSLRNYGVHVYAGADIISTGVGTDAATITLDGTGASVDDYNYGVYVDGIGTLITSVDGAIDITGQGGANGSVNNTHNNGILLSNDADITSTGTGAGAATITLDGTAGAGMYSVGTVMQNGGTLVTSVDGAISIMGQGGGFGTADHNYGIYLLAGADIKSTGMGANAATITLDGTGGAGDDNNSGVRLESSGTLITSVDGAISITGQGGANGVAGSNYNHGIFLYNGADITSTGTGADAATITLDGTAGAGELGNRGIVLSAEGTLITSVDGAISITGQGGSNASAASVDNYGIYLRSGADVISTGTGGDAATITLDGTGGAGDDNNSGVHLENSGTLITSEDGAISITGQGGSNSASGSDRNYGIFLYDGADVASTGSDVNAATITLNGTGGAGDFANTGVRLEIDGTSVTSVNGDVTLIGQGGTNGLAGSAGGNGIFVFRAAVSSSGTDADAANLIFTGVGADATDTNRGIYVNGPEVNVTTAAGDITITGTGQGSGTGNDDVEINSATLQTTNSGHVTINADTLDLNTTPTLDVDGDLTVTPRTTTTTIGLGGGAGTLNLDDTALAFLTVGGDLTIGTAGNTGALALDSIDFSSFVGGDVHLYGGDMTLTGAIDFARNVLLGSSNDITLSNAATFDKSVANSAATLTMQADRSIVFDTNTVTSSSGDALSVTLNADRDADQSGNITLTDSTITTSGGDFIAGGGLDPTTTAAYGAAAGDKGVVFDNTDLTTAAGNISLRGHGADDGVSTDQYGVHIHSTSTLSTTTGTISIDGTGGAGDDDNIGVYIKDGGTLITSVDGAIDITGQGSSNGASNSGDNYGVYLASNADITSTGTGVNAATITLDGTGGSVGDYNYGVYITNGGTLITSVDGTIDITGQGGASGTINDNLGHGILLSNQANIISTGTGVDAASITLDGTGGLGAHSVGVRMQDGDTLITSVDGAIDITGQGGNLSGADYNAGIYIFAGADIKSTGTGVNAATITLNGTGGAGDDYNSGIRIETSGTLITSVDGVIDITGQGGSNGGASSNDNYGISIATGADITSTGTGGDAATITMNGTGGNGGSNNSGIVLNTSGSTIKAVDGEIVLVAQGQGSGTGNLDFNNATGVSTALETTGSGRWLIYTSDPTNNTLGGIASDFKRYNKTYAGYPPASVTEIGNGFLYSIAPTLTVTADDVSRIYGDANAFTASLTGFIDGDTAASAVSGNAALTSAADASSNVGSYTISAALGTLLSDLGYQFSFVDGTLNVTPKDITIAMSAPADVTYGTVTPTLTSANVSDVNGDLVGADTLAGLGLTFDYGGATAGALNNAGTYVFDVSALSNGNYTLAATTSDNFTINKRAITAVINDDNRSYGDANPTWNWTDVTWSNLITGQDGSVIDTLNISAPTALITSQAGTTHAIGISSFNDDNYTLSSFTAGTLTINKATLNVALSQSSYSRLYGLTNPNFTLTYSGFKGADTALDLDQLPTTFTTAQSNSPIGTYDIDIAGGFDDNYNLIFVNPAGSLAIGALNLPASWEYNTSSNAAFSPSNPLAAPIMPPSDQNAESTNNRLSIGRNDSAYDSPAVRAPSLRLSVQEELVKAWQITQAQIKRWFF